MKALVLCLVFAATAFASGSHLLDAAQRGNENGMQNLLHQQKNEQPSCEEEADAGSFTVYDHLVLNGMLVISLGIGVFYGFFDKSSKSASATDFMLGSEMTVFPVTLSLTTSFITAIELLGNPAEIYFQGGQFALICISMVCVIPLAVKVFFPIYDGMKLTSCYEYLGMRFGKEMRVFGGSLYIVQMCFYTSVSVLAPAIALSKATGMNTRLGIVLIYIVCIFYSSQGGLKAVVIADTFQTCVLVVSLLAILGVGTYMQEGGIGAIFKIANENERLDLLNFDPNPTTRHTALSVVIGGFFYWASLLCVNQATVQKAMSLRNLAKAKVALSLSIFGLMIVFLMNFYTGFMIFGKYKDCDPLQSGKIEAIDQLVPYYVMESFGHLKAFVGLFVAGVFAASLGTVAACLSSLSAVTLEDLVFSFNIKIAPEKCTRYAKWMNFGYGIISFGLIFLVEGRGILQATLTLNGLVGGILLGLFSLGIFFKSANLKGALYGGALSTLCVLTLGIFALTFGDDEPPMESSVEGCSCFVNATAIPIIDDTQNDDAWYTSIYKISYMWYSMVGTILTICLGLLISNLTHYYEEWRINKTVQKQAAAGINGTYSPTHPSTRRTSALSHSMREIPNDKMEIINEETLTAGGLNNRPSVFNIVDGQHAGHDNKAFDDSSEVTR